MEKEEERRGKATFRGRRFKGVKATGGKYGESGGTT